MKTGKTCRIDFLPYLVFLLAALFLPSRAFALNTADVTGVNFRSTPDYTQVVITLSDKADFTKSRLLNPDRLYFDINGCRIGSGVKALLSVGDGKLKSVRTAQFNDHTVRVVFDLEKGTDYSVLKLDDPRRIVVDINGGGAAVPAGAPVALKQRIMTDPGHGEHVSDATGPDAPPVSLKKRIVIDPGHGGHDSGAIGPDGLYEKDVVLDIALKLKKILSQDPNYEVFLTRDKDVFIPLPERTKIANRDHADLFLSIHANASTSRAARGVETYFLNWTNDEETMKVAARENQITMHQMRQMKKKNDVLDVMLGDLARANKRDESMALANYVQDKLVDGIDKDNPHVVDLGVKWALFYVLFGAQMPSVLVEVSFISNPHEEKLLSESRYREDIARSLAAGIRTFMKSAPGGQMVARNNR